MVYQGHMLLTDVRLEKAHVYAEAESYLAGVGGLTQSSHMMNQRCQVRACRPDCLAWLAPAQPSAPASEAHGMSAGQGSYSLIRL